MRDYIKVISIFIVCMFCQSVHAQSTIEKVEYFFDVDPGFGNGIKLAITPGATVDINTSIDVSGLTDGLHRIYIRSRDSEGDWSYSTDRTFYKGQYETDVLAENITEVEYFFNEDPGYGNGIKLDITPAVTIDINKEIDIAHLPNGSFMFYIRAKNATGVWSPPLKRFFIKEQYYIPPEISTIKRLEYFIDADPGEGNGTALPYTMDSIINISALIDISALPEGEHTLSIRIQDMYGMYSRLYSNNFFLDNTPPAAVENLSITVGNSQASLSWDKNLDADFHRYNIYAGTSSGEETLLDTSAADRDANAMNIKTLTNDIEYFFYVTALDSASLESIPSNEVSGTPMESLGPPPIPEIMPASHIRQFQFRSNWEPSPTAHGYYLDVSRNYSFSSFVTGYNNLDIGNVNSWDVSGLSLNTTYYYRVRVYGGYGTSDYSNYSTVTTLLDPPLYPDPPQALEASNVINTGFTANWNSAEDADGYRIDVASDNLFKEILPAYNDVDLGDILSAEIRGLSVTTTYYYRIRAYNEEGISDNSNHISLTTLLLPPPDAPVALEASLVSYNGFTAGWNAVSGATGYRIDVAADDAFTDTLAGFFNKDLGDVQSFALSELSESTAYYYRIRAYNEYGIGSASNVIMTTTLQSPPEAPLASDATDISLLDFSANWEKTPNATGYQLHVATDDQFNGYVPAFNNRDVKDTASYHVSGLYPGVTYYYRVRAYNGGGLGAYSSTISLTTVDGIPPAPGPPVIIDETNISQTSFVATWHKTYLAEGYRMDVSSDQNFSTIVPGYNNKDIGSDTSATVSGLTASSAYYYRIRAYNAGGVGNNSVVRSLTTLAYKPSTITGLDIISCNNLVTLRWEKNSDNLFSYYRIYSGLDPDELAVTDSTYSIEDTVKVYSGLNIGDTYYYQVSAVHLNGLEGDLPEALSVTVQPGVIPRIASKWNDVLICYNIGDSLTAYQWFVGENIINGATKQYYVTGKVPGQYYVFVTDINGCQNVSAPLIINGQKSIEVVPNPVYNLMSVELNSPTRGKTVLSLISETGAVIRNQEITKNEDIVRSDIDVSALPGGRYFLEAVINGTERHSVGVIIIR